MSISSVLIPCHKDKTAKDGKIVKFQPANTPTNEYHSYEINKPRDLPSKVRKQMEKDGLLSKSDSNKLRKGKKKK